MKKYQNLVYEDPGNKIPKGHYFDAIVCANISVLCKMCDFSHREVIEIWEIETMKHEAKCLNHQYMLLDPNK